MYTVRHQEVKILDPSSSWFVQILFGVELVPLPFLFNLSVFSPFLSE